MKKLFTFLILAVFATSMYAQKVSGKVMDENGEALIGASVVVKGTTMGTITDFDGMFEFANIGDGNHTIEVNYLGYQPYMMDVALAGSDVMVPEITLVEDGIGIQEILVVADIATDRKTPVAVSSISSADIETKLGSQELPELLKVTPSVYATKQGGGYGDANLVIRGFNQRNTAVLINGIPVNDMENGWVYWSNWAGLSDVTRTMQVQRGLGNSKLAIASVGGTVNIVTKTTDAVRGGTASLTYGNDNFLKAGLSYSTGRMDNGLAVTFSGSRTQGDGYIQGTYIDAWSYFAAISKDFGTNHTLSLTAIGAPQKHGQRTFREKLNKYVDISEQGAAFEEALADKKFSDFDKTVSTPYGDIAPKGSLRYNGDMGFLDGERVNTRENFYHKPQFALNHYWNVNEKAFLATSAYLSIGRGGGTGDRGRINGRGPWGYRDQYGYQNYQDIVAWNKGNEVSSISGIAEKDANGQIIGSKGGNGIIKRASMNEHNWLGVISKFDYDLTDNINTTIGVDLRKYKGLHYRKLVNLFGLNGYKSVGDKNNENGNVITDVDGSLFGNPGQDKKINYDNDGHVGWQGVFGQIEYDKDDVTLFGAASLSNTSYKRVDRFNYAPGSENEESDKYNFAGYNLRFGINYNLNEYFNVFGNTGYFSKAPTFDAVFPRYNNVDINSDAENEKVFGIEGGLGFRSGNVAINFNLYSTQWRDKSLFTRVQLNDENDGFANISGLNALHKGMEIEFTSNPFTNFTFKGSASFNDWKWQNNVNALISNDDNIVVDNVDVYADGLKVGNAPQTQLYIGGDYKFDFGLGLDVGYQYAANHYANFDVEDRSSPSVRQSLKLPDYGLLDAGVYYNTKVGGYRARLRFNMNNVLDELYVAEANDAATLDQAAGFFGFGRTWNTGLKVWF